MSALDKDSGVRRMPQPTCPECRTKVFFTSGGRMIHIDPRSGCRA